LAELTDAMAWYLERSATSGERFFAAFTATLRHINEFPQSAPIRRGYRRFPMPGFPFAVFTDVEAEVVVAVAHAARQPGYFRDRDS
jgi:hypothetical protein